MPITKDNKFVTDNLPTKGYGKANKTGAGSNYIIMKNYDFFQK